RLGGVALFVQDNELDLLAADTAGGVNLINPDLNAVGAGNAVNRNLPRQRSQNADLNGFPLVGSISFLPGGAGSGVAATGSQGQCQHTRQQQGQHPFHIFPSLLYPRKQRGGYSRNSFSPSWWRPLSP